MPRKPQPPKPIMLSLTSDKTGVTLRVGNSPTTAATLYPRHVTELANLLGMNREGVVEKSLREQLRRTSIELETAKKERDIAHASRVEAVNLRDAAVRVAKTWEDAASRNLDDLNAANAKNKKLNEQLDRIAIDLGLCEKAKEEAAAAFSTELSHAKALSGLLGVVAVGLLIWTFISYVPAMSMRGAR